MTQIPFYPLQQVDKVTEFLREEGINAVRYHAGMAVSDKTEAAADWRADRAHVMVATSGEFLSFLPPHVFSDQLPASFSFNR